MLQHPTISYTCFIYLSLRDLACCPLLHLQSSRWPRCEGLETRDHQPRRGSCVRATKRISGPSVSNRAVLFKKKPEWTLIGCCRLMKALPELHQCPSSHQIACLHRESHAGLLLVANETNQALARKSDGLQIEWTRVSNNSRHPVMRIHRRITTTRYTSRISSSKPAAQTSGLCTTQLMAEERRKAHMAMCRRRHSVQSWRIGIHRKARHAPRLRWTRWPVSLAQAKL